MSLVSFEKELIRILGLENRNDVAEIQFNFVPGKLPKVTITLTSIELVDDIKTVIQKIETHFLKFKEE